MKIGIMQGRLSPIKNGKIQSFPWENWKKEIKDLKKMNIKILEWTLDYPNLKRNPLFFKKKEIKKLDQINVNSVTCDFFMQKPFFKSKNKEKIIEDFNFVFNHILKSSIKIIVIPLVDNSSIKSRNDEFEIIKFFLKLKKDLKKYKKKIAFEIDYKPKDLSKFISKFPKQYYGIHSDIGNSASLGYNVKKEFKYYKNRIINIHLKDREYMGTNVRFGNGNADFKSFFFEINKLNYKGNLIFQSSRSKNGRHKYELLKNINFIKKFLYLNE